jgi:Domain of unknown function (DUF4381)
MTNAATQPGLSFAPGASGMPSGPGGLSGMGAMGAPTPAPIHDIVGPLPFFSGPVWVIVLVFLLVAVAGVTLWWFAGRKKEKKLSPRESALRDLERLRSNLTGGTDHEFGAGVSDVLRRFLGEALGLAAPRQTTEEFLESLQGSLRFLPAEQEALASFLHQSDFLKYARGEATSDQREALIVAAESFVRSGEGKAGSEEAGAKSGEAASDSPAKEAA